MSAACWSADSFCSSSALLQSRPCRSAESRPTYAVSSPLCRSNESFSAGISDVSSWLAFAFTRHKWTSSKSKQSHKTSVPEMGKTQRFAISQNLGRAHPVTNKSCCRLLMKCGNTPWAIIHHFPGQHTCNQKEITYPVGLVQKWLHNHLTRSFILLILVTVTISGTICCIWIKNLEEAVICQNFNTVSFKWQPKVQLFQSAIWCWWQPRHVPSSGTTVTVSVISVQNTNTLTYPPSHRRTY